MFRKYLTIVSSDLRKVIDAGSNDELNRAFNLMLAFPLTLIMFRITHPATWEWEAKAADIVNWKLLTSGCEGNDFDRALDETWRIETYVSRAHEHVVRATASFYRKHAKTPFFELDCLGGGDQLPKANERFI